MSHCSEFLRAVGAFGAVQTVRAARPNRPGLALVPVGSGRTGCTGAQATLLSGQGRRHERSAGSTISRVTRQGG